MLEYTPSHLSPCNNLLSNLVQTWGVKMCTDAAVSLDSCTTGPQMRVFLAVWFVYMCMLVWKERWRPSFISYCDQIFYMIWYDDTGPIMGWAFVKNVMTEQAEDSTVIWHLRGRETLCMWERKVRKELEWVEKNEGRRGERTTGRVMHLKDIKMRENSQRELIWLESRGKWRGM